MAKDNNEIFETDRIIDSPLEDVIHNSMIPYAEYVIMDRAIPRVEDGLKPVQRRILYTMYELGLTPDKPTRKSARIVGDCLGKFHPHGDSSVYGALVRMGQDFSVRNTLVDGQGNFGSIDGDSAAAMRYTEARMTPLAMEILRDLDKNTVEYTNNFDDTMVEPVTLPGRFPNLLVNGASGIAVGLATNIPTHNISEAIDAAVAYINNPKISLKEIMEIIPAPDFSSGGYIIKEEIEKAYTEGRGRIMLRAKVHFETEGNKDLIVVTEIPYGVNKAELQKKIIAQREMRKGVLLEISEVVDESDLDGMRVVIKLKKDADKRAVLAELFKRTDLMISFNLNMVAIAGGKPRTMALLEILDYYVKYQISIIVRRSKYEFDEAKKREHILDGLVTAVTNIDEVIEIIKTSKTTPEAKQRLQKRFALSAEQAQAILDLRLARITSMEVFKLETELKEVKATLIRLQEILKKESKQKEVLISEMLEIKEKYGDKRRSIVVDSGEDIVVPDGEQELVTEDCCALLSSGKVGKYLDSQLAALKKDKSNFESLVAKSIVEKSNVPLKIFTNLGNLYTIEPSALPFSTKKQFVDFSFGFEKGERAIDMFSSTSDANDCIIFFTREGMIKKSKFSEYTKGKEVLSSIKLKEGDEVISVQKEVAGEDIFFATKQGICLKCDSLDIPEQGRVSMGVKGINLSEGDEVVFASQIGVAGEIVVVTNLGEAKRVILANIPKTARYRKGVKLIDIKGADGKVAFSSYVKESYELALIADSNDVNLLFSEDISIEKREAKGKVLKGLKYFKGITRGIILE